MKFWISVIVIGTFLKQSIWIYASAWTDDVIASQLSMNFADRNDENHILQIWETKTCLISTLNKCNYLPHTKIVAIRLVEMQSHDQRYFAYHFKWPTCGNFVAAHEIVLFDSTFWWEIFSKGVWWETKQEHFHGLNGFYCHVIGKLPRWCGRRRFQFTLSRRARGLPTQTFFPQWRWLSSWHHHYLCITKLWRAFTSIERVRTRTVRIRRQVKFTYLIYINTETIKYIHCTYSSIRIQR